MLDLIMYNFTKRRKALLLMAVHQTDLCSGFVPCPAFGDSSLFLNKLHVRVGPVLYNYILVEWRKLCPSAQPCRKSKCKGVFGLKYTQVRNQYNVYTHNYQYVYVHTFTFNLTVRCQTIATAVRPGMTHPSHLVCDSLRSAVDSVA